MNSKLALKSKLLAAVAAYCELGWHVFPCKPNKTPLTKRGFKDATTDPDQHEHWWKKWPDALIGVATGATSGMFVVDIDIDLAEHVDGSPWWKSQCEAHGAPPRGPIAITPRGGRHCYFKYPEIGKVRISAGKLATGIDIRGDGGYVIAPPSVGEKGEYRWEISPDEQAVPDAPNWLLELVCDQPSEEASPVLPTSAPSAEDLPFIERAIERQLDAVRKAEKGTRNSSLNTAAFVLGKVVGSGAVDESVVVERLTEAARSVGLEPDEIRRTIASGLRAGKRKPWRPFARDEKLHEINRDHFFAIEGKAAFVYREEIDPVTERRALRRIYPGAFELEYRNRFVAVVDAKGKATQKSIGKYWLEWHGRRQHKGVVFDPRGTTSPEYYNQWHGLAAEPIEGDCSKFSNLIHHVLCSGDQAAFDYLIRWCARAVQEPATPGEVAIVLKGAKGVGKTFFASHLGELFGDHYVEMSHSRHLVGNFNAHLETAILAFADEAFWAGDKQGEGTLKALVTSRSILFERKGIDAHTGPNYVHLIVASNSDWVVPASLDERRFFVLDVSETRMGDHAYFEEISTEWQNGGREAFLHHLISLDLKKFNVRQVPQTEALFDQKRLTFNSIDSWYFELLQKGTNHSPGPVARNLEGPEPEWAEWIETRELLNDYRAYCEESGMRAVPSAAFGVRLNALLPPEPDGGKLRCQRSVVGKRTWGYEFPTLKECRAHFEKKIRFKIDWEPAAQVSPAPKSKF